jgi:hypothetical protein
MEAIYSILRQGASRKLLIWARRGIPHTVHQKKTGGNLALVFTTLENYRAVGHGRVADVFVKQTAERTQTLETDFEANVSYRKPARRQQLFRLLYAPLSQILMGSLIKGSPEEPQEVIAGQTCFAGDLLQIERLVVTLVDELASAHQPSIRIGVKRRQFARSLFFRFHRFAPIVLRRRVHLVLVLADCFVAFPSMIVVQSPSAAISNLIVYIVGETSLAA